MNFFRKKKNPEKVQKSQDEHLINELCGILKKHGKSHLLISIKKANHLPHNMAVGLCNEILLF